MRKHHLHPHKEMFEEFLDSFKVQAFPELYLLVLLKSLIKGIDTTEKKALEFLLKYSYLKKIHLQKSSGVKLPIYIWRTPSDYSILNGIDPKAYYTHYSALFINQLTLQIPKTLYLNRERARMYPQNNPLTQEGIDSAFKETQRKASNYFRYLDYTVFLLNGQNTERMGVIWADKNTGSFSYTDLERTLLDSVVRPNYAGGVFEVLEAFRIAKDRLDCQKLFRYLKQMNYTYPYEQAIGFYLEKAGFEENSLELFASKNTFRFYLTYNIRQPELSQRWNIVYPKGF